MSAATLVGELELDLDSFEGPFDLLLSLVLRDELPLSEVELAAVVLSFVDQLAERAARPQPIDPAADGGSDGERPELDLEACGEFLVLISSLLELKARALFPDEEVELAELDPEEAAEELARRLAEYRRAKGAAAWLADRLAGSRDRFFRLGPAPLAPARPEPAFAAQDPVRLGEALRALAVEPPAPSTEHMALRFPPVGRFVERWRSLLRRRSRFDFDQEVAGLSRVEVAVAFLALLELRKLDEVAIAQAESFAPIRVSRAADERSLRWTAHSA